MRPGRMIQNQGKRMREPCCIMPSFSHYNTRISARFISPKLCWGGTFMIMMMNRAIWMLLSSCVICELCATHRLMSSHNEPAPTQLRPWSSSGALPPSHEALYVRGTWWSVLNSVFDGLWLDLSSCNCESGYRSDYIGLQRARLIGRHHLTCVLTVPTLIYFFVSSNTQNIWGYQVAGLQIFFIIIN